ncbi:MAG: neutral/alkaline non-lysosomal ceramidase N-terminal domain-containing protein [Deltaproteobacteria bacterium]|nr:neutral/alkaline non-lysosomal ceramidase N-terminal domain-containing protein [Deltaproteobacteria bacterium]
MLPPSTTPSARAGGAVVDITPDPGVDTAGYSVLGPMGRGYIGRLTAQAMVLEDSQGERFAWVSLDLLGASRFLHERVAERTAGVGLPRERLLLAATHTHTGPGHYFGNTLYDRATAQLLEGDGGFEPALAAWIADRIALAVEQAVERLAPARIGVGVAALWGVSRCASMEAFLAHPEAAGWDARWSCPAPDTLGAPWRAIDPRVVALVARGLDGALIGVQASFGTHASTLGSRTHRFSPDWPGYARKVVMEHHPALQVAGVCASASGDQSATPLPLRHGHDLARQVGAAVGATILRAIAAAQPRDALELEVRYHDWDTTQRRVGGDPSTLLAERWGIGVAVLGGAEEGPTGIPIPVALTGEGYPPEDPRHPMVDLRRVPGLRTLLRDVAPGSTHGVHLIKVQGHAFFTFPGEPTVTAAARAEGVLREVLGVERATAVGYANDYLGYFTTEEEYRLQHYEAASNVLGRNGARHHRAILRRLGYHQGEVRPPAAWPEAQVPYLGAARPRGAATAPVVRRWGDRVLVKWRIPDRAQVRVSDGPLLRLLEEDGVTPVHHCGLPFDDAHQLFEIAVEERYLGADLWSARFVLPHPLERRRLLIEFPDRVGVSGFSVPLHPPERLT